MLLIILTVVIGFGEIDDSALGDQNDYIYLIFITSSWLKNIHIIKEQDIYNLTEK